MAIRRPDSRLLRYYALSSLVLGPLFPVLLVPRYLKYRTLQYAFDEEGVTMRWGALFHREIRLDFTRLQDIHMASNVLERYLGLARVLLQTASGSARPEMIIEGVREYEAVRDFLYQRMHGRRMHGRLARKVPTGGDRERPAGAVEVDLAAAAEESAEATASADATVSEALVLELADGLERVADELAALRAELAGSRRDGGS